MTQQSPDIALELKPKLKSISGGRLGPIWGDFGPELRMAQGQSMVNLAPIGGQSGIDLRSLWSSSGANLRARPRSGHVGAEKGHS